MLSVAGSLLTGGRQVEQEALQRCEGSKLQDAVNNQEVQGLAGRGCQIMQPRTGQRLVKADAPGWVPLQQPATQISSHEMGGVIGVCHKRTLVTASGVKTLCLLSARR